MMDPAREKSEAEKPILPMNDSPAKGPASTGTPSTTTGPHPPPSPLSGCYLLVVLPEPHFAQHKDLILNRVAKGFLSWDKDNCHVDLEKELQALVVQSPEGEEARNGERLIQYATENLVTEILIHPQTNTLLQCIRNLLASFTKHRHIIHAGYTFGENGSWILQDGTFSLADFLDAFNEHDVQRVLRAYENSVTVDINCAEIGEWSTQRFSKEPCTRTCRVRLNPDDVLTAGVPAITSFTKYIEQYLVPQTLDQLMQPSDVVGNIRFSHPTLYVFPGGQGDAALFGINGFNMLVDGGFARKSCFWDFTRHLDRLDAVLLTRINNNNVAGMSSVLAKKRDMQVYPQIGHFFCNLAERKHSNSPDGDKDLDPLILSLTELGQEMMLNLKHINLRPHPCYRDPEPINLYHKVGHGTLDMYVLSPSKESREVREFLAKWNSGDWKLFAGSHKKDNSLTFPIQNMISICALLVWQPANPEDTITRILFPGSTPQHKIFEGMERLRHLEFLKHPTCSAKSISPSASLVTLKDKPAKQKLGLIDREMKRAVEIKKQKREIEKIEKVDVKPITKKSIVVENKKVDADVEENKTSKTIIETKEVKETKKIEKELKKTEVTKTEKTATKEIKTKIERKKEEDTTKAKELPMRFITGKTGKTEVISEKKIKEKPAPKKDSRANGGISSKPEQPKVPISKPTPKPIAKSQPAAPKSAKDANNRKVVEQKNIERMSIAASATRSSAAKNKTPAPATAPVGSEKKPVPRRPKPAAVSPSKTRIIGGSPVKSAKSTPTASVKSDKDGVLRRIKSGAGDSSVASTPSAIEVDSLTKFTDKCLTEKSEDMSLDSIESKVLADLKEERKVVEEIEAVLQKAERIEGARKAERLDGEDEVTGEITAEKKDITEDMTEDDVTADIDEVPRKSPIRKASHEQMTEEEDEYLIIEKEEGYTEDSAISGEHEHKHFLDAVESEKEKAKEEMPEKSKIHLEESEESEGENDEESGGEEKEVADEKGMTEDREKSDDIPEKKLTVGETHEMKLEDKEKSPIAEYKEQLKEEMKGIIMSAAEIVQKTEDKDDSGKKDSEDLKEISSLSPEKLDSSEKKTDTDAKPEIDQKTKEKLEESQEKISTVESGQTTTAPTLPEDERIPVDVVKPIAVEKPVVDDKKAEISKPKEIAPLAAEPSEVKPDMRAFNLRQGAHVLQRDIVKTPDEVADLPVHEEVDPILYKMEDFEKPKDDKIPTVQNVKDVVEKDQKGVLGFFGKVADKFEKGMDKLTGKTRRDSEKDVDEKSSKSGSPKEERRQQPILEGIVSKEEPGAIPKIGESSLKKESPEKSIVDAPKIEQKDIEKVQKLPEDKEDLEDVEALLEEASKKFKDVKDSIHDSLESLDEKVAEEEFNRASELAEIVKNEVKGTLEEVVGKLENIKPDFESLKEEDKAHFTIPKAESSEEEDDDDDDIPFKNVRGAVKDVGGVLAGTAGIIIEDKPKDVVEIVKKVAEVLKEDDFLSDEILFKDEQTAGIEQSVQKTSAEPLEVSEEPCLKKTIDNTPILSSPINETLDKKHAVEAMCEDLMDDYSPVHTRAKRSLENLNQETDLDVLEVGLEEVCHKVHIPEPKDEKRGSMEIEPSEISFDHNIAPDTAELVIVSPDSQPPSPKFTSDKVQSKSDEKDEIETIISEYENIMDIIEEMVFVKNKKITFEIIEIIRIIKRVPKEQILHIIEELSLKKKVPWNKMVVDGVLKDETHDVEEGAKDEGIGSPLVDEQLKSEIETEIMDGYVSKNKKLNRTIIEEIHIRRKVPIKIVIEIIEKIVITKKVSRQSIADIPDNIWNELKLSGGTEEESEGEEEEEDEMINEIISEIGTEIVNDYVTKGKKLTKNIIEEIHIRRKVPIRIIIEIIEEIVTVRKISRQSFVDFSDVAWNEFKSSNIAEDEPEEKSDGPEKKESHDDFELIDEKIKSEVRTEIVDDFVTKGKKLTKNIIEEIHIRRKIPTKYIIEIIEEIVTIRKVSRQSIVDFSDAAWNEFKTNEEPEKKSTEVEEEKIHPDSEIVDDEISLQIESEIINEYVSKNKKLTRSNIEEIHVKRKIPKSVIVEIIERITIIKKISRQSFVDISETDWNELRILDHHSEHSGTDEEDIEEDDELLQGFVQIPAESSMNKFHRESDKLDDFEAVEQEYKISGAKAIIEKGKIGIEEAFDTDNSDIIEADDVLKPKIELDKSTKPSPLTSEILHKVDEKERKPSLVGLEEKDHEKPEDIVRFSEDIEDKDAQIVRRMIVTATSEDGGEETEVCPTGSITFTKTISPDDSLRSSPVKTAADKDSLQSTTSTMETDSLNKTLSHIHDSETLDDSIEEKPLGLSFDKKDIKEVETKSSEIDQLDDYSPAESMIGSPSLSAAKDLPKAGIFESKEDIKIKDTTHTEEEKILDIKKSPEVSESSKSQSPIIAQKDEIELSLDKSTSSSITSILQEEKEPDILQKPEGTKSYENLIEKKEEEKLMIGAESSNIETSRKKSLVDVEKEKPLTSEIEILSSSEAEDKKKEEKEKTTDHKSPTPIDTSTRMESPIHQDQIDKMEKADVAPDSNKGSPITNEKTSEEKGSLAIRKESVSGIVDTSELAIKISDKKLEDEAKEDIIDRITPSHIAESVESLASDIKSSASSPGISPVKKESIIPGKIDDSKTDEIGVSTLIHEISSLTKESIAPVKDGSKIEEVEQPSHGISSVRKESIIPDKEDDFKAGGIKSSASSRATSPVRKESIIPEKDDSKPDKIGSPASPCATSPGRKESIIPEKDDSKPDKIGSPASPCATSPGRKESIISEKDDSKPKEIKSSASSRATSPVRKEGITPEKADSKPKEIKSSASSRTTSPVRKEGITPEKDDSKPKEIKSSASSRTTSPVRKESIVLDKKDDSKPEEIKSSASSRATSPVRKESIIPEKADSKPKEIKSSASSRTTSPVRKESTIHEKDDFKAGGIESSTSSHVTSPVRKDSIIPEKDDSKPKEIKSSASSRTTSPVRKESIVPEKKDNSKTEEIKSSTSSRATSPEKKGSIILERLDDFKSGDIKSSTSPSPISPDIKDNIVQEKHDDKKTEDFKSSASLQLSPIRKDSISPEKTDEPKAGEIKSSGSPVRKDSIPEKNDSKPEEVKSSASSHATSPVRKESIIPEKVDDSKTVEVKSSASSRAASPVRKESIVPEKNDSKPEEVKSSASSHATSPVRKESIIPEKVDDSKTIEVKSSASSRATSPVRKESIIPEKSDSKPEEVKSSASSHATSPVRKESIIPEKVDDSKTVEVKSSASSRATSPVRKESIIPEKNDSKPEEVKSSASSRAASPVRKESIIPEKSDSKPGEVKSSASSPVRKESIIPEKVDDSKTVEVKSSASPRETSPVRKESIIPEKNDSKPEEVKSSASSRAASPVRKESIIPEKSDSKPGEVKSSASSHATSPVRKESIIPEKVDDSKTVEVKSSASSRATSPVRKESIVPEKNDSKPEEVKSSASSHATSPVRKESIIPEKVDDSKDDEAKLTPSTREVSPIRKESFTETKLDDGRKSIDLKVGDIHGDQKSPSSITQNIKSPASPQDISPIRKESLAHDEIQPLSHAPRKSVDLKLDEPQDTKKSPSPIAESIKSSESPRDISPLRKDSVFSDMKDKLDDAKFPASPQNISPERRESIHHDEKIKHDDEQIEDKLHDSISPRPSMGDIKSSIPSTIAKESIVDEAVEKPDDEKRSDIKSLQSHLGDSEARKDSIVSDEKEALRKLSVGSSHDSAVEDKKLHSPLVGKVESTISSRDPSPETKKTAVFNRFDDTYDAKLSSPVAAGDKSSVFVNPLDIHLAKKDSTTTHETVLTSQTTSLSVDLNIKDVDDDNKATSPIAESVKSAASPAGISPVEKESVAHDKTIPTSQTPRQSVDLKIDDLLDTKKTGGPIDEIAKSSVSPSDISQVQGESSAHDEKIDVSKTPRQSVDLKIDNLDIDGKIPSPIAEGAKSSTHITSPVRKESLADCSIEGKLPSSIAESVKSSALPHDITIAGKENFSHDGIIHADVAVEKITSPIVGKVEIPTSPADISPVKEDKSHSSSQSQRQSVDLKLGDVHVDEKSQSTIAENVKSSSSPLDISPARKESLVHDDPLQSIQIPRQSVDLKLDETHFDQKTASQTTESVVSDVHLILDDKITKDEKISSPKEIPPIRKDSSAFEEKINKFEGEIDKKSPASPQDISLDKKDSSAHDDEILVRQSPRQSIDLKKHDLLVGEKSADPTIESVKPSAPPTDISPRKESFSQDAPIPTSQVPSKSAVMKSDNLHFDEKSPIAESEKSSEIPPAAGGAIDSEYKTKSSDEFTKSQELISGRKESMSHEVKEQSTTVPFSSGFGDKLEDIHGMFEDDPDLASRSRSSSMASEFPEDRREEKFDTKSSMDMMSMSMVLNPAKEIFKTAELDAAFQKISSPVPSIHDDEVPSRDRSRSHSLFEGSEKTPVGRSRAASLFEDDMITKTISRKSSGLSEFPEEHLHESGSKIETIEDEFEVTVANKKDIERYIMSQYVTRKIKITMATLEEIVSLYEVPSNIVIEIISEICDTGRISKESIIDFEIDAGDQNDSAGLIKQSESTYFKRIETESYIVDEYIKKNRKISWKIIEEISVVKDLHVNLILEIIEFLILQKKISRESLLDEDIIAGHLSERKASTIKEVDEEEMEGQMRGPERIKMSYSGMETGYSGESTPRSFDSPKRITKEHYDDDDDDDKYESPFHKAFVGGMTEIRTTHITTLSGKSTPDVGLRTDTPDSGEFVVPDSDSFMAKSSFMTQREPEYETIVKRSDPIVIKRTIVTDEGPEYQTVVKTIEPTTIKRTVISEDDPEYETQTIIKKTIVREVIEDEDGNIVEEHKGISKSDIDEKISQMMNKSLGQSSSGRSTPDKIRESPVPRSSTGTPDSFCSSEVIRTTITKTRTISGEGEIITTTKEVTETTNERGETTVLEEKIDVKTSTAEPGAEVVSHQWIEGKHEDSEEEEEEEEDEDPLSGKSQVFHLNKSGNKEVEFSTADMSSSFYGTLPNIPQTKHGMDFKTDDGEHTFTKFTVEKRFEDSDGKVTSTSKTYKDVGDFDIDKVLKDDDDDDDEDESKKDPLKDWGTPLKLPHPEKPEKFNLRTTPIVRNSLDMSPDSLNFDVINNWGEPLRLPSPAPGVDEASNKAMPTTPKKEKKAPRKIVAENLKNKKRSDSPAGKDKKKDQKKVQPVYLDLTYVPHHGNSYYASLEFFKRVRARYYVFSGTEPSREVYDALLDAKKTWENKNLEVTMIPTYDTDTLGYWVADNEEALAANHIDLSPSASRCTINLQDHETSCSAYRLEF